MTQEQLTAILAHEADITRAKAADVLDALAAVVHAALAEGQEIKLPGLCKISVAHKPQHKALNPMTGEPVMVAAHNVAKFKALKPLREAIQ
jgi:nucleoid DNA-binding protein